MAAESVASEPSSLLGTIEIADAVPKGMERACEAGCAAESPDRDLFGGHPSAPRATLTSCLGRLRMTTIARLSSHALPGGGEDIVADFGVNGMRIPYFTRSRRVWLLMLAFSLALGATGFFATRFVVHALYWSHHKEEPIAPWMTVGYVAHSYGIAPTMLREKLGLDPEGRDRRTLAEIAADQGRSFGDIHAAVLDAIAAARSTPPSSFPNGQGD